MSLQINNDTSNGIQITIEEQTFQKSTIDPNLFQIEDVVNDNACFYRSITNVLNYSTSDTTFKDILALKNYGNFKELTETYENEDWGYWSQRQDLVARALQQISYNWIKENYKTQLKEYGMDIGTMILLTHEIDIEVYLDRYKFFAGDLIVDGQVLTSAIEMAEHNEVNKISHDDQQFDEMEDRWGGTAEQIALSEHFKLPIIILTSQKFNKRSNKINTGKIRNNKAESGVKFKLLQVIGSSYLAAGRPPIFVLWKKHNRQGHYLSLYVKDATGIPKLLRTLGLQ